VLRIPVIMMNNNVLPRGCIFLLIAVGANAYIRGTSPTFNNFPVASLRLGQYSPHDSSLRYNRLKQHCVLIKTLFIRDAKKLELGAIGFSDDRNSVSKTVTLTPFRQHVGGRLKQKHRFSSVLAASKFKTFEEMLDSYCDVLVLVNFSSPMCLPCKSLDKEMDHVRDAMKDNIKIFNVDTDRFPDLGSRYNVKALPCILLFKKGNPVGRIQGIKTAQDLIQQIKKIT